MDKDFVQYEQALALKELGFDEPCLMFYEQGTSSKWLQKGIDDDYWGDYSEPRDWNSIPNKPWKPFCQCISAPLYQQAFRWFREKYDLDSHISRDYSLREIPKQYCYTINTEEGLEESKNFNTYEEAELECLRQLIEIVKDLAVAE